MEGSIEGMGIEIPIPIIGSGSSGIITLAFMPMYRSKTLAAIPYFYGSLRWGRPNFLSCIE